MVVFLPLWQESRHRQGQVREIKLLHLLGGPQRSLAVKCLYSCCLPSLFPRALPKRFGSQQEHFTCPGRSRTAAPPLPKMQGSSAEAPLHLRTMLRYNSQVSRASTRKGSNLNVDRGTHFIPWGYVVLGTLAWSYCTSSWTCQNASKMAAGDMHGCAMERYDTRIFKPSISRRERPFQIHENCAY